MIDYMKADAKKQGVKNFAARLVKPDDPGVAPHSADVVEFRQGCPRFGNTGRNPRRFW